MKKFLSKMLVLLLAIVCSLGVLGACGDGGEKPGPGPNPGPGPQPEGDTAAVTTGTQALPHYGNDDPDKYNKNLFYRNDLDGDNMADISAIYITEGEEKGWFYKYGTTADYGGGIFLGWRSQDMATWECTGPAYEPRGVSGQLPRQDDNWATQNLWAPEVIYYKAPGEETGKYYMFFSAMNQYHANNYYGIGLAVADKPSGPFIQWTGTNSDGRTVTIRDTFIDSNAFPDNTWLVENNRMPAGNVGLINRPYIDASPFIDDDGQIYLYFTRDRQGGNPASTNWGIRMKDMFTPDYESAMAITVYNRETPLSDVSNGERDSSNEGPFMIKHDGKYYMTFSISFYGLPSYSVAQAVSDSPLGLFRKIPHDEGGVLLTATGEYWMGPSEVEYAYNMAGAGHHSFVRVGDETFIAYHAFTNRGTIAGGRRCAIDRVEFINNGKETILYANGPTFSVQPKPAAITGYGNIAPLSEVKVNRGENAAALTDGIFKTHNYSPEVVSEFTADNSVQITMTFPKQYDVTAVMVYNAFDYAQSFSKVDSIMLDVDAEVAPNQIFRGRAQIRDLMIDREHGMYEHPNDTTYKLMYPGGAAIAEFNPLSTNKVVVTINRTSWDMPGATSVAIPEIVVLGKESAQEGGTAGKYDKEVEGSYTFGAYSYENPPAKDKYAWRHLDNPEGVVLDGVFDEAIYEGLTEIGGTWDTGLRDLKMSVYLGEEGFFAKVVMTDPLLFYNNSFSDTKYNNSGIVLHFGPDRESGTDIRKEDIQLRIFCNSLMEPWYGQKTLDDDYPMIYTYLEADTFVRIFDKENNTVEVNKYDEVSLTSENNIGGYAVEAYIKYSAIGLADKPAAIIGTYQMNFKDGFADARKEGPFHAGTNHLSTKNYIRFTA